MDGILKQKFVLMIFGPTAVGKSDFAEKLAANMPAQISPIKHNLFDIIDEPRLFNVCEYRKMLLQKAQTIWDNNELPILVGGSGFYLKSLFFPPISYDSLPDQADKNDNIKDVCGVELWNRLNAVDPQRAAKIDKNDTYRIQRALDVWSLTGKKPSERVPVYDFPCNFILLFLTREREELYKRIDDRVGIMMNEGWIDEVKQLQGTEWETFLKKKKLIGYDIILDYLEGKQTNKDLQQAIQIIQQKTRNYAKRQVTFFKSFERQLKQAISKKNASAVSSKIEIVNLTLLDIDLYIKQLLNYVAPLFE